MSGATSKPRGKKHARHKHPKLSLIRETKWTQPEGSGPEGLTPLQRTSKAPLNEDLEGDVENQPTIAVCRSLMESMLQPHCSRPKNDLFGFYAICKWYPKEMCWSVLYVGKGYVRDKLEGHFSGRQRSPISSYLSSFPRQSRNLIWFKWIKDPYYPHDAVSVRDLLPLVSEHYNYGEPPAFNLKDNEPDNTVPDDFTLLPDWDKPKKKKAKQS